MPELNCWELFDAAVMAGSTRLLVWGPKGLAKSYHSMEALRQNNKTVLQCTLNDDIAVQELLGHYVPKGTKFEWSDGPVTRAYRDGHGLVVNELSRASGAVQDMFLGVLDDPAVSMLTLPNRENVTPGAGFRCFATANHSPDNIDEAITDRFEAIIHVTTPHPSLVLILDQGRPGLGALIKDSYADPAKSISPRRGLAFLKYSAGGLSDDVALRLSFGARHGEVGAALKAVKKYSAKPAAAMAILPAEASGA